MRHILSILLCSSYFASIPAQAEPPLTSCVRPAPQFAPLEAAKGLSALTANPYPVFGIQQCGDLQRCINLVFLGDGFTRRELNQYRQLVSQSVETLFSIAPFQQHRQMFNIYRVEVPSRESGQSRSPTVKEFIDTPFYLHRNCTSVPRLPCADFEAIKDAASGVPADYYIVIGNNKEPDAYSGAAYGNYALVSATPARTPELVVHELGHTLGLLADEYDTDGPERYEGPEPAQPNISRLSYAMMKGSGVKWDNWLDALYMLPPGLMEGTGNYEGGYYSKSGIFRPTYTSVMREAYTLLFNAPSAESLVVQFLQNEKLLPSPSTEELASSTESFAVNLSLTDETKFYIRWLIDGVEIPDQYFTSFSPNNLILSEGEHTLTAEIAPASTYILSVDANERATRRVTWQIYSGASLPPPHNIRMGDRFYEGFTELLFERPAKLGATAVEIFRSEKQSACQDRVAVTTGGRYIDTSAKINSSFWYSLRSIGPNGASSCAGPWLLTRTINAPEIIQQPFNKIVREGRKATLTVKTIGTDVQYQWYRDGKKLPKATSSRLTIEASPRFQKSRYWVVAKNHNGQISSKKVRIRVALTKQR